MANNKSSRNKRGKTRSKRPTKAARNSGATATLTPQRLEGAELSPEDPSTGSPSVEERSDKNSESAAGVEASSEMSSSAAAEPTAEKTRAQKRKWVRKKKRTAKKLPAGEVELPDTADSESADSNAATAEVLEGLDAKTRAPGIGGTDAVAEATSDAAPEPIGEMPTPTEAEADNEQKPPTTPVPALDEGIEVIDVDEEIDVAAVLSSFDETGSKVKDAEPDLSGLTSAGVAQTTPAPAEADEPLSELSRPEDRDRLIAQALAHAEAQDARYRVPMAEPSLAGGWKGLLAVLVFMTAGYVAVAPPQWVLSEPVPVVTQSDQLRGLRVTLLLQAQEIDTYRVLNQRLPDSLDELSVAFPGVTFVKSGGRSYQLFSFGPTGERVVYDPASPDPAFHEILSELNLGPDS